MNKAELDYYYEMYLAMEDEKRSNRMDFGVIGMKWGVHKAKAPDDGVHGGSGKDVPLEELYLPKAEYARFCQDVDSDYFKLGFDKHIGEMCVYNNSEQVYIFLNKGRNDYLITDKIPVKENEDLIAMIREMLGDVQR